MKKSTLYLMMMVLSLSFFPVQVSAATIDPVPNAPKEIPAEIKTMINRLEEIRAMDKSELTSADRKALRKEVRTIKADLKASGNGVYLSIGAIIVIILLLILIL